ncbi:peroxisomal membrane protein 11B [Prorops nasuta]|uniref:peroxisomal membrane protein 11B n=1 Tax=Prorops nasuta TaxID=863751 RepID=UPI0034CF59F8
MDIIVKLNEQTSGRDKIIRLLQYGSRAGWYYMQSAENTRRSVDVLRSLEYTFSSFRKLLRFGRFLDSLYSALKLMKYPDLTIRVTLILAKISNALFLLADHIIWLGRVGITRVNIEKWSHTANKYWLMSIIMNLSRDFYEILKILEYENKATLSRNTVFSKYNTFKQFGAICLRDHKEILMDTARNGCDLFIPLTALGYTKLTPGTIGMLGLLSSMIGLYTIVYPFYKLTPS